MIFGQKLWILPFGKSHCFALFKTLFFWSKNYSIFLQNIKKQYFLTWFLQKIQIRKISIFGQKPWIIPFGKSPCFALLNTLFFWSKNRSFLSRISKTMFSDLISPKNTNKKNFDLWTKPWIIPLRNWPFFRPFKTLLFRSKIYSFSSRIPRNDLFEHNFFKNTNEKKFEFWAKTMH